MEVERLATCPDHFISGEQSLYPLDRKQVGASESVPTYWQRKDLLLPCRKLNPYSLLIHPVAYSLNHLSYSAHGIVPYFSAVLSYCINALFAFV
jgi:hypothetical protein